MMGAHVLEQARLHGTSKLVLAGTICAYPKFTPVPFREDDLWDGYPEETNAPYGVAKKARARRRPGVPGAVRRERDLPAARQPVRAARQLRPRDVPRDPRVDPEDGRGRRERESCSWGDGSPTREFLYVDDCVEGLVLAAERYDGAAPVNLGTGEEISIRDLAELVARGRRDSRARSSGTRPGRTASRAASSTRRRAEELFGFRRPRPLREGIERTVAWYREHTREHAPS